MLPWRVNDADSQMSPVRAPSPKWADNYIRIVSPHHLQTPPNSPILADRYDTVSPTTHGYHGYQPPTNPDQTDLNEYLDNGSNATESTDVCSSVNGGRGDKQLSPRDFSPDSYKPVTFHLTLSDDEEPVHDSGMDISHDEPFSYFTFMQDFSGQEQQGKRDRNRFDLVSESVNGETTVPKSPSETAEASPVQFNGPVVSMMVPKRPKRHKHKHKTHHEKVNEAYGIGPENADSSVVIEMVDSDRLTMQLLDDETSSKGAPYESNL